MLNFGGYWGLEIGFLWIATNQNQSRDIGDPFSVRDNYKSFGLFHDRDTTWTKIQYQSYPNFGLKHGYLSPQRKNL
jgi:hypothetical protein